MRYLLLILFLAVQSFGMGSTTYEVQKSEVKKELTSNNERSKLLFRYQGQYEDQETGLYYNRFRYYSPDTGVYLSQDPIGLAGGMPNMYSYVSDVNSRIDVLGLSDCSIDPDFDNGASFLTTGDSYEKYIKNSSKIGRLDGQFVAPSNQIDDLLNKAKGNISIIEDGLGIPSGSWLDKGGLYKIDIPNPKNHNIRPPNSNLSGANELFIPGGTTSGGISEAVIDQVSINDVIITKIL